MDKFVVGFLFNPTGQKVLLVTKEKPDWQRGCLNGIGGKIEMGETPEMAMKREGLEEIGISPGWIERGVMRGQNNDGKEFECFIFSDFSNLIYSFQQKEDEKLKIYWTTQIFESRHISNLEFIIPYLICDDHSKYFEIRY